jgi:hypothetical protein
MPHAQIISHCRLLLPESQMRSRSASGNSAAATFEA